jgi:hypothetical protein
MTTDPIQPTDEQLRDLAAAHLAANPDDSAWEVLEVARAAGFRVQPFQAQNAVEHVRPIATLATIADAAAFMTKARDRYGEIAVFWDRGWGDSGKAAEITVVANSNGQIALARLTSGLYEDLRRDELIAENSLQTYKARRFHDFVPTVIV